MHRATARLSLFFVFFCLLSPTWCEATGMSECIIPHTLTITPARVTGAAGEHVKLSGRIPGDTDEFHENIPDGGYLLAGDKVNLVTICDGYAYVRFEGLKRVSTGWIEQSHVKASGKPYMPIPANAALLCKAAQDAMNHGSGSSSLKLLPLDDFPSDAMDRLKMDQSGSARVAYVKVGGRPIALVNVDTGGSCATSKIIAMTGDLASRLSPYDLDDRNPRNTGQQQWDWGATEVLVEVLGQPMVLSKSGGDETTFYLSVVDKKGDIVPTCEGGLKGMVAGIRSGKSNRVCQAILSDESTEVPMDFPAQKEKLVISKPSPFFVETGSNSDASTTRSFNDRAQAAVASYTLQKTGLVDVENSGLPTRIGVVSFVEGESSAGCGDFSESDISIVHVDDNGVADLSAPSNLLFKDLGQEMTAGSFLKYAGTTYFKLDRLKDDASEIWKIDSTGSHKICDFQRSHYVMMPIKG